MDDVSKGEEGGDESGRASIRDGTVDSGFPQEGAFRWTDGRMGVMPAGLGLEGRRGRIPMISQSCLAGGGRSGGSVRAAEDRLEPSLPLFRLVFSHSIRLVAVPLPWSWFLPGPRGRLSLHDFLTSALS